jgi:hypothetical protein
MRVADVLPVPRHRTRRSLALATAALTAVALTGCTIATSATTDPPRTDTYPGDIATVVLDFDDLGAKQIGSTSAAVRARVTGADRDGVQVDRTMEYTDGDRPEEHIEQAGDTLTITTACPDHWAVGTPTCHATYAIQVPYGTTVRAGNSNGDLTTEDTRGEVELRSHDGDITVTVAPGETSYAVTAVSQDGEATVDVPQDPGGVPIRIASDDGDVTVRQR